ncbi:MAG: hypothetical protein K6G01_08465 [Eubacterium sp.]|nr:hypothetical protein [Eubacterium sp.]
MKEKIKNTSAFSYGLEMIILVFIFLVVAAILIKLYGAAVTESERAQELQDGVFICRNAAEAYAVNGDLDEVADALEIHIEQDKALLDESLQTAEDEAKAKYELVLEADEIEQGLLQAHFQFYTIDGELIYELTTEKYVPEVSDNEN